MITMTRATRWVAVLAVLACAAPGRSRADDVKTDGDLKKMQGTWVNAGDDGVDHHWVIKGDTVKVSVNGMDYTCTITVDSKANPLPTADFTIKFGPEDSAGKTAKGIYKLDGDRLVFCVALPSGDARPSEFKTIEKESYLIELKPEK